MNKDALIYCTCPKSPGTVTEVKFKDHVPYCVKCGGVCIPCPPIERPAVSSTLNHLIEQARLQATWEESYEHHNAADVLRQMADILERRSEISVPLEGYDTWQGVLDENRKYEELLQKQMKRESQGANHNEKAAEDIFPTKRESNSIDKAAIIAATRAHMRYMRHTSIGPVSKLLKICIEAYLAALPVREIVAPIPMMLQCPKCDVFHVDKGEWTARPHKTHLCEACGNKWCPANVPTVGVYPLPKIEVQEGA